MGFTPPQTVRDNAKRGLELRAKFNRGGTAVGVARARDLSNGASLSLDTIQRMNSYFSRHEVDKKGEGWGKDSAGYIAWLLWGGDAGWSWAKSVLRENNKKDKSMINELAQSYAQIVKQEKQADGTLKVYGKATDDSLDIDKQICDETWLKRAMPDWFISGGNVREQHSNIAAGVATDYEVKDDGHYITALVVDPVSVKKVETGVLKGFSIGIRSPRVIQDSKAAGGRIVDGQIVEVSLVDRPANPNAKLMLAKATQTGELMKVEQNVPSPADVARLVNKSDDADAPVETPVEPEVVEVTEEPTETVVDIDDTEDVATDEAPEAELVNTVKSLLPVLNKFDQATYDNAITALSELIIVEANEMKAGSDERESIKQLLHSIKHLFHWYTGEAMEGEVATPNTEVIEDVVEHDDIQLSAMKDVDSCDCEDGCDCMKCDYKMCKCYGADKSVSISFNDDEITAVINKAVATAKETVATELNTLKAAKVAAEQKVEQLSVELEAANNKAISGGPKRGAINTTVKSVDVDALLVKAAEYRTKAEATRDTILAKGYRELAEDLIQKAEKAENRN
jgi:hypothetical protein